jgi:hypothetical protein
MTYKESYQKCKSIEELRQEVVKDIAYAQMINPDRMKDIVSACEEVANEKFGEEKINIV